MNTLGATFSGQPVLITGHTGFKGSWLSIWLAQMGARVTGFSLPPPTSPSNYVLSGVRDLLADERLADVRDVDALEAAVAACEPRFVFHLAAQPLVRESYWSPRDTFDTNVMGTVNVLDVLRRLGQPCVVVVVTSDKCYELTAADRSYAESDPVGGFDPYSASKGAAEIVAAAYRRSFFSGESPVSVSTVRAGNVIGGGDWAVDRIVPDFVRAVVAGGVLSIRHPAAIRPWQHVLEPLSGYLLLASRMATATSKQYSGAWNFGPSSDGHVPVSDLITRLAAAWGSGRWEVEPGAQQLHEAPLLRLSIEKARSMLEWRPRWDIQRTIERTATWYRAWHAGQDTRAACHADIAAYEGGAQV